MIIRKAKLTDIDRLSELLYEVHKLHAKHRPDVFKKRKQKYTKQDLETILTNDSTPVWVAEEKRQVVGYIFCIYEEIKDHPSMTDRKTLYIDDLCVDKEFRKKGIKSYAAHLDGKNSYDQEDYCKGTAILIGNEGNGLRDEVAEKADIWVRIPMEGQVESLNAAIAASVLMFEVARQRRQ